MRDIATTNARPPVDIAIIGGGINGCGIARDNIGRGWSVFLCEKGDLAGATSSVASKLIHGGLRYLEYYVFRLVREAMTERETLWRMAPHVIWPLRFVLPHHKGLRPAWLLRLGLFLCDHLGARELPPATRTLKLRDDPAGAPLKPQYTLGFEYSDCRVEDSRLVVLNVRDAADRGATIAPRTACVSARREAGLWRLKLHAGDPGAVAASDDEIDYLCKAAADYFRKPVTRDQVKWSYSGVRPLFDDGATTAQAATRENVPRIDAEGASFSRERAF